MAPGNRNTAVEGMMYKNASRNLQRQRPRRGLGSSSLDTKQLDTVLKKEGKARLREAPIASAAVPGERAADLKRVQEIRLHQKEEKQQLQEKIKERNKGRKSRKSRRSDHSGRFFGEQ